MATCPSCDADLDFDEFEVDEDEIISCGECNASLRVASTSPLELEVLDDDGTNKLTLTACHPKLSAAQRIVINATLVGSPLPKLSRNAKARTVTITDAASVTEPTTTAVTGAITGSTVSGQGLTTTASTAPASALTVGPETTTPQDASNLDQGLAGDRRALAPSLAWGSLAALIGLLAWATSRSWQRSKGRGFVRMLVPYVVVSPLFLFVLYLCFTNVDRLLPAY